MSLARSSSSNTVIPVPLDKLKTNEMKHQTSTFMNCLEERIGNSKQPIFNMQNAQEIYYTSFGDELDNDAWDLPYGVELLDMATK